MILNRNRTRRCLTLLSAAALLLSWGTSRRALAERPPASRLLPDSTVLMASITDTTEMAERFMNTGMGRMSQDPQLKPLIGQLYGSLTEALSELEEQLGLTIPQLLAIPQGEVTLALVVPEEAPPAVVLLLDASDQLSNARKLLKRGTDALDKSNARKSEETVAGTKLVIYDGVGPRRRKAIYFEKDSTIVLGSDLGVLRELLAVWNGGKGGPGRGARASRTLSDNPRFGAIMQRLRGAGDQRPHFIFYVDPIGLVRGVGRENTQIQIALALLPALGLDGVSAVGGGMIFDTGQFDSVMHAHLLLESPRSGILKMIALESGDVQPEPWVPPDVASYTTLHWNLEKTYTTLANLYDSFREDGAFSRVLEQAILGPTGINLEQDIVQSLSGRITLITWIERPVRLQSQVMMLGLKLKQTAPVEEALKKLVKLGEGNLLEKTYAGKKYYQLNPPGLADLPPENRPPLPCFGILGDSLLIGNSSGLYEKAILTLADGSKSLADELDFKLIASRIRTNSGEKKPAMISFDRPEEVMRFLYELATRERTRQLLARQAENNPFFKSLDSALKENPLPPFAVLQRYLAPGGAMVVDDETGIHYTAFSMRRK